MLSVIDWILRGIGLTVVAIIAYAFLAAFVKGVRLSASFHYTMWRGMRLNKRNARWLRLPWSFIRHALDFGTSSSTQTITGDGWQWSTDGVRSVWHVGTVIPRDQDSP